MRISRNWLGKAVATAAHDERGTVAVIMALALGMLLLSIGVAIDLTRWHQAQAMTSAALDAAVLAGGRSLQLNPAEPQAAIMIAERTYRTNVKSRPTIAADTVKFDIATTGQAVTATGNASMQTAVLQVIGISKLDLQADTGMGMAEAEVSPGGPGGSNLEVSVMLDVTGSMCTDGAGPCTNDPKIATLKAAATDLVNIVVKDDQSQHTTKVALVPFSTRVRVGADGAGGALMKSVTNLDATATYNTTVCTASTGSGGSEGNGNWVCTASAPAVAANWMVMPCVTERVTGGAFDVTDDAPGANKWLNGHDGSRALLSWDSADAPLTSQTGTVADPSYNWNYNGNGSCADIQQGNEVVPLTSDKATLMSHIDGLQAYGATAGALGTAWSWYMVSPNWSGVWTGGSTPGSYADLTVHNANGAPKLRKVAILMTDGGYNTLRSDKSKPQQTVSDVAMALCDNMRAQGIEIFTVGFALNELAEPEQSIARTTLQHCGGDISHFYESISLPQLQGAFRSIGTKLSGIRLTR